MSRYRFYAKVGFWESSNLDRLCHDNIFNLQQPLNDVRTYSVVHEQKCQGASTLAIASELHPGNIHLSLTQHRPDVADNPGLVVVTEVDHMAPGNHFKRETVDIDNTGQPVCEDSSRNTMSIGVGAKFHRDEVRVVFGGFNTRFLNLDSSEPGDMPGIHHIDALTQSS